MTDIVKRLLAFRPPYGWPEEVSTIIEPPMNKVAAAEILLLRAENEKLRAAIKPFADRYAYTQKYCPDREHMPVGLDDLRAAAAAYKETGE